MMRHKIKSHAKVKKDDINLCLSFLQGHTSVINTVDMAFIAFLE